MFGSIAGQTPVAPVPQDNLFCAFLSKADLDATTNSFDLMFEMVPAQWMLPAIIAPPVSTDIPAPVSPALIYHIRGADAPTVVNLLGVKSTDYVAEGSWYVLALVAGSSGQVHGDLYDPDIDKSGQTPPNG